VNPLEIGVETVGLLGKGYKPLHGKFPLSGKENHSLYWRVGKMRYFTNTYTVQVEYVCPRHGLERWRIRVSKLWNVGLKEIVPRYGENKSGFIKTVRVGPGVSDAELEDFLVRYFYDKGFDNVKIRYMTR